MAPAQKYSKRHPSLQLFRKIPATATLIVINAGVFIFTYLKAGTVNGPHWTITLLQVGAQFNPLTLDKEWYRIFTQMFMHGGVIHLAVNMYALFSIGSSMEPIVGTRKFTVVYFVCGVAAALNSLYWSLFSIGVGASGAIFGLFGFSLIVNIFLHRKTGRSLIPILLNFAFFLGINLLIAKAVNADNAAHFGGLGAGVLIGFYSLAMGGGVAFTKIRIEYFMIPLLIVVYFGLPRYQVRYYKFFQQVLAAEDSTRNRLQEKLTDDQYLSVFIRNFDQWDNVLTMLNDQQYLPSALATDTFKLRRYIGLRKQENYFKKMVIQRESYIYLDSVAFVQDQMSQYLSLQYGLSFRLKNEQTSLPSEATSPQKMTKVLYDSDWVEIPELPAVYYRIGFKDSLRRWEGVVSDFYANGDIQMKGSYKDNKREGVFLYYSSHKTYTAAGRYQEDRRIGKWETFHRNGKIASETYYNNSFFIKNLWDSLGNQLVIDGNGREIQRYPNGVIAVEGEYRYGLKEGYWYGRYSNGEMYFEENFNSGRLVAGKSRTRDGETFLYDASSFLPMPEISFEKYQEYLKTESKKVSGDESGHVKISFRVTKKGVLTDLYLAQKATPRLDSIAREILLNGPRWLPARDHGHEAIAGMAQVLVEFY